VIFLLFRFPPYYRPPNKKCAAEATHEKRIAPIAATQVNSFCAKAHENRAYVFTNNKNSMPQAELTYSLMSQTHYSTFFEICKEISQKYEFLRCYIQILIYPEACLPKLSSPGSI
jgi:hypothetical protein